MVSKSPKFYYWDANVFLAWVNKEANRVDRINALWREIDARDNVYIATSMISLTEVAYAEREKPKHSSTANIDPLVEKALDAMWNYKKLITVANSAEISRIARNLIRNCLSQRVKYPKTMDAIHLATALYLNRNRGEVLEINTYEPNAWQKSLQVVPESIPVCECTPNNLTLFPVMFDPSGTRK